MKITQYTCLVLAGLLLSGLASAQATAQTPAPTHGSKGHDHSRDHSQAAELSDGEIRKVDKSAKKLTIKHGEIKNLDMPGMTMLFQVKDAAMLERVKPGDKVKFQVERVGGALVVTELLLTP